MGVSTPRHRAEPVRKVPGTLPRRLVKNVKWQDEYGYKGWSRENASIDEAEVVSSELFSPKGYGYHAPVLDIDFEAELVPSTTEGHYHLYLDKELTWKQYRKLLQALAKAGIIEEGYAKASIRREHTAVRVPWLKKPKEGFSDY